MKNGSKKLRGIRVNILLVPHIGEKLAFFGPEGASDESQSPEVVKVFPYRVKPFLEFNTRLQESLINDSDTFGGFLRAETLLAQSLL